jgi:hypothetical protein
MTRLDGALKGQVGPSGVHAALFDRYVDMHTDHHSTGGDHRKRSRPVNTLEYKVMHPASYYRNRHQSPADAQQELLEYQSRPQSSAFGPAATSEPYPHPDHQHISQQYQQQKQQALLQQQQQQADGSSQKYITPPTPKHREQQQPRGSRGQQQQRQQQQETPPARGLNMDDQQMSSSGRPTNNNGLLGHFMTRARGRSGIPPRKVTLDDLDRMTSEEERRRAFYENPELAKVDNSNNNNNSK